MKTEELFMLAVGRKWRQRLSLTSGGKKRKEMGPVSIWLRTIRWEGINAILVRHKGKTRIDGLSIILSFQYSRIFPWHHRQLCLRGSAYEGGWRLQDLPLSLCPWWGHVWQLCHRASRGYRQEKIKGLKNRYLLTELLHTCRMFEIMFPSTISKMQNRQVCLRMH